MGKIMYFDYCAFFVIMILLLSNVYRGMTKHRTHRTLMMLLMVGFLSTTADIFAVWYDAQGPGHVLEKYISHTLYLGIHNAATPLYCLYLLIMAGMDYKLKKRQKSVFALPFTVMLLALISNLFNHKLFYLDAADAYTRGPWFPILYITTAFYIIGGMYALIIYRKNFTKDQFISMAGIFPILITAMLIQLFFPKLLMEMFAGAVSLLLLSTMVLRPEDYIDTDTGMGKKSAYVNDMDRHIASNTTTRVVMINIANYDALHRMFGYVMMRPFVKLVAEKVEEVNKSWRNKAELYYLGAGRFRMVLDYRNYDKAEEIAKQINEALKEDMIYHDMEVNLVAVVCVADCPSVISNVSALMAFGEDLGIAHYNGRVRHTKDIYDSKRYEILRDMDSILENALANRKFEVYYQPIYSLEEERFTSAEALLRLKDEVHGFISPEIFIPAAEESGAIHKIGVYVLEEVCRFISSDTFKSLALEYIEINLSVAQCMRSDLAREILDMIKKYGVKPEQINLEITETAASSSQNAMMENIDALTRQGIRFALDDYGTGYSNARRIATMPLYIVKLDKSFINVGNNTRLQIVLENSIRMIKEMDMKIVVEGVESADLVEAFRRYGCEYIQGFYFSKPLPREDFVRFIEEKIEEKSKSK